MHRVGRFFSRFCIPLILLVCVWVSSNLKWSEQGRKYTIISDGKGYYSYLPAVFIYDDLHFSFFDTIEAKYYDEHVKYDYRTKADGIVIDKYFAGVAVMQLPFFLIGHGITLMSDEAADGYSKWYVILFCVGAIFWLGIGLYYLRKFLRLHRASEGWSAFIITVVFFGTNLFHYTLIEPAMSHLYSFTLVSMFLYFGKKWMDNNDKRSAVKCALLLGMIFLVRPVNVLIVFWLLFEAGSIADFWKRIVEMLRSARHLVFSVVLLVLPFFVQLLIWKTQTGHWWVNAYGDERFHFLHPHMTDFLISYKKGLFVYVPITFLAVCGLIPLLLRDARRALIAAGFLFLLIYILSCWWMWYYGGSFGSRVMIEYLPVFALLLLFLQKSLDAQWARSSFAALLVVLTLFCQFQTIQYRYELIHWSDMNADRYWEVFLQLPA